MLCVILAVREKVRGGSNRTLSETSLLEERSEDRNNPKAVCVCVCVMSEF